MLLKSLLASELSDAWALSERDTLASEKGEGIVMKIAQRKDHIVQSSSETAYKSAKQGPNTAQGEDEENGLG